MVIVDQPKERTLVLTRVFDAPRNVVFSAWTEPERAAHWWGPQGFAILSCRMDVRTGGSWRVQMRSQEGTRHVKSGVYREIVPPERLVFTWAWDDEQGLPGHETLVTILLEAEGRRTRLTLHQAVFETMSARDMHRGGWTSCLERFADYLTAQ
jgi:uncharacterized protein YndB with AHSA1/START domain